LITWARVVDSSLFMHCIMRERLRIVK
jgi:hypothetical protein